MSNNKQTPVEQLFHKLWDTPKDKLTWYVILKEHMEMEEEQIIDAILDNKNITSQVIKDAKQWYNNRFGDHEQAIIDYNKMEEESEMDDYNNLSND